MSTRRAGGDDPEPGRRHAAGRRRPRPLRRLRSTAWCSQGGSDVCALSYGENAAATNAGRATGCATTTRSRLLARLRASRQAGARHLPRPAADERGATAARCYQDIDTQRPGPAAASRCGELRPQLPRRSNSSPARAWPRCTRARRGPTVNSVHHQGIKDLAPGFVVEARCPVDGMIEAIRQPRAELHGRGAVASRVPPRAAKARSTTRPLLERLSRGRARRPAST